ncbi:hypothetical protein PR048_033329 [Dryococelus australis]|uniref:Uncharacterized protein n=1 Tax=Dryococelus australis TaxID=614101 RepID=A0ABQ9FZZ1_9NEOP|nr:hypothetical protein PR048_033329 [Dryococelus australis]
MSSPNELTVNFDPEDVEGGAPTRPERRVSRPRLNIPVLRLSSAAGSPAPPGSPVITIPITPVGVAPKGHPHMGMLQLYPTKAGAFMFKRFEGFKDFTMNTAKSGLSVGEKTAFWLYNKVRSWSKRWFTHIFLFLVVLSYSLLGATMFVAVEGTNEEAERAFVHRERSSMLQDLRRLALDPQYVDEAEWEGAAVNHMLKFEEQLYEAFKHGHTHEHTKVWSFWNAVFYCGTIYTTIGECRRCVFSTVRTQAYSPLPHSTSAYRSEIACRFNARGSAMASAKFAV